MKWDCSRLTHSSCVYGEKCAASQTGRLRQRLSPSTQVAASCYCYCSSDDGKMAELLVLHSRTAILPHFCIIKFPGLRPDVPKPSYPRSPSPTPHPRAHIQISPRRRRPNQLTLSLHSPRSSSTLYSTLFPSTPPQSWSPRPTVFLAHFEEIKCEPEVL